MTRRTWLAPTVRRRPRLSMTHRDEGRRPGSPSCRVCAQSRMRSAANSTRKSTFLYWPRRLGWWRAAARDAAAGTGATAQPPSSPAPAATLACKILQTGGSEEFDVTTTGGGSYPGTVYVSFYGGRARASLPEHTVNGATATAAWHPVPAADIGASAEPIGCAASAG